MCNVFHIGHRDITAVRMWVWYLRRKLSGVEPNILFQCTCAGWFRYERIIGNKVTPLTRFIAKATILPSLLSRFSYDLIPDLDSVDVTTDMSHGKEIGSAK